MALAAEPTTRKVFVVPPGISLFAAWDLMSRERFRHLPVVSGGLRIEIAKIRGWGCTLDSSSYRTHTDGPHILPRGAPHH